MIIREQTAFRHAKCALLWIALVTMARPTLAENWPNWRGPRYNGTSQESDLPLFWSESSGIAWTTALDGLGASTPVVWDDAVYLTTHAGDSLELWKIDVRDGQPVWKRQVASGPAELPSRAARGEQKFHRLHNLASPSPATDGEVVVAHFGNGVLAAYDLAGEQLWQRDLQQDHGPYTIWWGHANSPVLYEDLVISVCMQDSLADLQAEPVGSYIVAHDKRTGHPRWFTPRPTEAKSEECDSYTTPVLVRSPSGEVEMIIMGGNQLDAYDPRTGKQLWSIGKLVGGRTVTGPVADGDLLVATVGMRGPLTVFPLDGERPRKRSDALWKYEAGTPDSSTPAFWDGWLFAVTDNGIAKCFHARGGQLQWKQRLPGNDFKTSPLAADDRIYFLSRDGVCTVIAASDRFDVLATNKLDDEFLASPIASGGHLFLRGAERLYCVGPPW